MRDQPRPLERTSAGTLRQPPQRLLAPVARSPASRRSVFEPQEHAKLLELGIGLTNAARRTTKGSSDLRKADFAGAAERLAEIARTYRPGVIAFVGKVAYTGPYGGRVELGVQERALGTTALYVLPSTSPANAAVPWEERLRWFRALRALVGE